MPLTEQQQKSLETKRIEWRRVHYVEAQEVLEALDRPGAMVVDTRGGATYQAGHFPGARHGREEDQLKGLPRDADLYLYCT